MITNPTEIIHCIAQKFQNKDPMIEGNITKNIIENYQIDNQYGCMYFVIVLFDCE